MPPKPAPMTLAHIDPELRPIIQRIPRIPVTSALGRWLLRAAFKLMVRNPIFEGVRMDKHNSGGVNLRLYTPAQTRSAAALLWIHGGGMIIGAAAQDDAFCATTARELGIIVISTEYRLAPEHPFPAALDDCLAAWNWIQTSAARLHIDPTRVAIGGQSAGGGLAASLVQRIHDQSGTQPIAQWLFCPMLDDRTAANRDLDPIAHKIWDNRQNHCGWRSFLAAEPGADQVPAYAVAARRADLSGLPPAWIGVGDIELFFAEDKTYAERLTASGVNCALDVVPAAPHGFEAVAPNTRLAQTYLARARAWLAAHLTPTTS